MMRISVICPVLDEEAALGDSLRRLQGELRSEDEVVVSDGGSTDSTCSIAERAGVFLVHGPPGRGLQMNAGAAVSSADVLVFLHADTRLPVGAADTIRALVEVGADWGRFDVCFDVAPVSMRVIGWFINQRSRLFRSATGDQAIFVRREVFQSLGGYLEPQLFEDVELVRRLRNLSSPAIPRGRVTTSSRRWLQNGVVRTVLLMWVMKGAYLCGVPSGTLLRWYAKVR